MAARRAFALLAFAALVSVPAFSGAAPGLGQERFLVSLHGPLESALPAQVQRLGGRALEDFTFIHVVLVEAPAGSEPLLRALPGVAGVYREEQVQLNLATSRPAVRVTPQLWDAGVDGSGVTVAVVDSGIDADHPALRGRVLRAVHVDGAGVHAGAGDHDGHGTHIAGIVAGDGTGSAAQSHAGMAPRADLVAVDISSSFTTTNAVRGFAWLAEHARELNIRVVSNSWGREKEGATYDKDDPVIRASDALVEAGVVVVFSAGNLGPGPGTLTTEAQNPNVITVGASDDGGRVESYSSRGPAKLKDGRAAPWAKPDLVAPGTHITSTRSSGERDGLLYTELNGTSMAAPHVAGVAALLLTADPALGPVEVKQLLTASARDNAAPGLDLDGGAGFLDGLAAARGAQQLAGQSLEPEREPFADSGKVTPAAGLLPAPLQNAQGSEVRHTVVVPQGAIGLEFALRWDDPRSAFKVTLEKGSKRLGPFTDATSRDGWMEIRGVVEDGLEPGTWSLVARTSGPSVTSRYTLDGAVLVLASHGARPLPLLIGKAVGPSALFEGDTPAARLGLAALAALPLAAGVAWLQRPAPPPRVVRRVSAIRPAQPLPPAPGAPTRFVPPPARASPPPTRNRPGSFA